MNDPFFDPLIKALLAQQIYLAGHLMRLTLFCAIKSACFLTMHVGFSRLSILYAAQPVYDHIVRLSRMSDVLGEDQIIG